MLTDAVDSLAGDRLAATCAGDSDIRVHDLNAGAASCQVYRSAPYDLAPMMCPAS